LEVGIAQAKSLSTLFFDSPKALDQSLTNGELSGKVSAVVTFPADDQSKKQGEQTATFMRWKAMPLTPIQRRVVILGALILLHAGLTVGGFLLYARTAMVVSHGAPASEWTTLGQYVKSFFLWPLLLPILRYRPLILNGLSGFLLVLLNSTLWIAAGWWVYRRLHREKGDSKVLTE
jgi:hypothetical protein